MIPCLKLDFFFAMNFGFAHLTYVLNFELSFNCASNSETGLTGFPFFKLTLEGPFLVLCLGLGFEVFLVISLKMFQTEESPNLAICI
jgi:hypothetical protein